MKRNTKQGSLFDASRIVWFKRRIKVTNPENRFENQDFEVGLMDERGAGESYERVYNRLKEAGNLLLLEQVLEYVTGQKLAQFHVNANEVKRQYNL